MSRSICSSTSALVPGVAPGRLRIPDLSVEGIGCIIFTVERDRLKLKLNRLFGGLASLYGLRHTSRNLMVELGISVMMTHIRDQVTPASGAEQYYLSFNTK